MEYTIRKMTSDDMFNLFNVIAKLDIESIADCFSADDIKAMITDKNVVDVIGAKLGVKLTAAILKNLGACRMEIYCFVASMIGYPVDEIGMIPPADMVHILMDIFSTEDVKKGFASIVGSVGEAG